MGDRNVKVTLRATVAEYKQGMQEAAEATRRVGSEAEKLAQQKQAFQQIGAASLAMGVTVGAAVVATVAKFADFDQAMSNVAATGDDARGSLAALRQAAIDAGASTVFSAEESANAIEEMAKAGVSAEDVLAGGLTGALNLASAGGLGVADAAGIAATALKVFNLQGKDMSHVADLLAAGAGKAMGDVSDLSQALAQGGQVAAATGLSIEETTATLAAFASQGLLGSDAGTSFKTMLQRLTPQSAEAKKKMDELGISAYDASGQFIGMEKFAGNLQTALKNLTPQQRNAALSIIFGSDSVRAANVLYREGADGVRGWINAVNDQGYAADTARTKLDNLKGDWEGLSGAVDSAMIGMGQAADGPLRFFVQSLTDLVDTFNDLPDSGKQAAFWVGAVGSAGTIALGTYLLLIPKIAEFKTSLETLGTTAQRTAGKVALLGRIGVIGATAATAAWGVDAFAQSIAEKLLPSAEQIDNKIRTAKSGIDLFAAALESEGIHNTEAAAKQLGQLGSELDKVAASDFWHPANTSGTAVTVAMQLATIAKSGDMATFSAQFRRLADDAQLSNKQMQTFITYNPELKDALTGQASAAGLAADAQTLVKIALGQSDKAVANNADALEKLQGVATDTTEDVNALADAIRTFGSAQFDTERASIAFNRAFDDVSASLKEGKGSLDVTTEAGQNTVSALLDAASATNDYAAATSAMGGATEDIQRILDQGRQKIIDTRVALGESQDAAKRYADQLIATPATIQTQVALMGIDQASQAIEGLKARYNNTTITLKARMAAGASNAELAGLIGIGIPGNAAGGIYQRGVRTFADGGFAPGIYPYTPGGINKFAEEYGEAFISLNPSRRERSVGVWQETGRLLGVGDHLTQALAALTPQASEPTDLSARTVDALAAAIGQSAANAIRVGVTKQLRTFAAGR